MIDDLTMDAKDGARETIARARPSLVALSRVPAGISWVICNELLLATEPRKSVFNRVAEAMVPAKTTTAATSTTSGRRSAKPSTGR